VKSKKRKKERERGREELPLVHPEESRAPGSREPKRHRQLGAVRSVKWERVGLERVEELDSEREKKKATPEPKRPFSFFKGTFGTS